MASTLNSAAWLTQAKRLALATAVVTGLAACTAAPAPSSSSATTSSEEVASSVSSETPSSISIQSSSSSESVSFSSTVESTPFVSSSVAPSSSSAPVISSSSVASSSSPATSDAVSILLSTGQFENGAEFFGVNIEAGSGSVAYDGTMNISITKTTMDPWGIQVTHPASITENTTYTLCYDAKAAAARSIGVNADINEDPYTSLMGGGITQDITTGFTTYKHTFVASGTKSTGRITINLGDQAISTQFDNIGLFEGNECGVASSGAGGGGGNGGSDITTVVPISTQGNQVLFDGKPGSIAGPSLFWSTTGWGGENYYNADVVREVKTKWGAKLIRAAMGVDVMGGGGYLDDPSNKAKVETVIDAAIANDMYVIIDWHTHNAEMYKSQAITFFKEMATKYGDKDNVIYEIYNEPINSSWTDSIRPYAMDVIKEIRAIDPDNLIIVGTRFYSQNVDEAADNPITGYKNIAYTLHFYSATHKGELRGKAAYALSKGEGIPLFVTEWGVSEASGAGSADFGEADTWLNFLRDNNISHANWALNSKEFTELGEPETSSALKTSAGFNGNWSDNDLTESGKYVKEKMLNW